MRKRLVRAALLIAVLAAPPSLAAAMSLTSRDVVEGGTLAHAQAYGACGGGNVSPELSWAGAPANTKSFAVTLFDPDAASGWWHWIVLAIPAHRHELAKGAGGGAPGLLPAGAIEGTNDFGEPFYGGPCPPSGDRPHRYRFTLWALDTASPPFGADASGDSIAPWLKAHALATATLTARYGR